MTYTMKYNSPIGELLLSADEKGLTGLWLANEKYFAKSLAPEHTEHKTDILSLSEKWLDIYFMGKEPDFIPPLNAFGTPFQKEVWNILLDIPYGKTTTYSKIAEIIAEKHNIPRMSAQAVGGAVGHNEISIIIPCHRVIGKNGNLTGYAGGIERKIKLLKLEGAYSEKFFINK